MSKKPHPTVPVTVKLSPELAKKFYEIANREFGGNLSEAVREAIKQLVLKRSPLKLERLEKLLRLERPAKAGKAETELIIRLESDKNG